MCCVIPTQAIAALAEQRHSLIRYYRTVITIYYIHKPNTPGPLSTSPPPHYASTNPLPRMQPGIEQIQRVSQLAPPLLDVQRRPLQWQGQC